MPAYFLDTSAAVKLYVSESGSEWLQDLTTPSLDDHFFIVRTTEVELTSAITRRRASGSLAGDKGAIALASFRADLDQFYRILEINIPLLRHAAALAETHLLRAYDAVQLAAALKVAAVDPSLTLISADRDLNKAAVIEGISVDDPNSHGI